MVSSLPNKRRKVENGAVKATKEDHVLQRVNELASQLPPSAPKSASLNPLVDLVSLFKSMPLSLGAGASPQKLEGNRQAIHAALHALKITFEALISQGRLHGVLRHQQPHAGPSSTTASPVDTVKEWIKQRWNDYLAVVSNVIAGHWDPTVRSSALAAFLSLVRTEASFLTALHPLKQAQFPHATFKHLVHAIVLPSELEADLRLSEETRDEWIKYFGKYDDLRFHFLKQAATLSPTNSQRKAQYAANLLFVLEELYTMPTVASELDSWYCSAPKIPKGANGSNKNGKKSKDTGRDPADTSTGIFDDPESMSSSEDEAIASVTGKNKRKLPALLSLSAHRKVFQEAWLALLAEPLSESERKRVLVILHRQVLPHMSDAKRTMDWLTDCADEGGTIGILALNGLFTLITKHNLEYPDFYTKLYALLDRHLLFVKYRPRFFRLLDVFLSSTHLPSTLVASFIKRLCRLALNGPPAAIVTVVPFVYNLLKRHPSCMPMIHRPLSERTDEGEGEADGDGFDEDERDPNRTGAIDSSLWELETLQSHYLNSVSGLSKIFNEAMTKPSYTMEDFLDHSYTTMFESEVTRKVRVAPALAPVPKRQPIKDSLFPRKRDAASDEEQDEDEEPVDIVSRLFTF